MLSTSSLWSGGTAVWPSLFVDWRQPEPPRKPQPLNPDVAGLLSPSQLNTWLECQAKWMYRYLFELPDISSASLALGRAVHTALGENFQQKIETKLDMPVAGVMALALDALARELKGVVLEEEDADLGDTARALVMQYMEDVAPTIEPAAAEQHVEGTINGVRVHGYIDLIDVDGRIIDIKTAKRKPTGIRPDYRLQVATYQQLAPTASGLVKLDTLVKSKTVQVVEQSFEVTDQDRKAVATLYPLAQEGMRSGLYMPNRNSMLCSQKYCSYWERCEADFGGCVE